MGNKRIYIGTSGWQYKHWRGASGPASSSESFAARREGLRPDGSFYPSDLPQKDWLKYYCQEFNTVEINSTFYRQAKASTFKKWASETPDDFVFSIKGNRFITHIKRLKDCREPIKIFFKNANALFSKSNSKSKSENGGRTSRTGRTGRKNRRHVILWQLPPSLKKDIGRLKELIEILSSISKPDRAQPRSTWRHAFEFRHESWVDREVFSTLQRRDVECTAVFQDWKDWPAITENTEIYRIHRENIERLPFIYIRFHGKDELYTSNYSQEDLAEWAKKMQEWKKLGLDIYAYFNNDALGYAPKNALTLKGLI